MPASQGACWQLEAHWQLDAHQQVSPCHCSPRRYDKCTFSNSSKQLPAYVLISKLRKILGLRSIKLDKIRQQLAYRQKTELCHFFRIYRSSFTLGSKNWEVMMMEVNLTSEEEERGERGLDWLDSSHRISVKTKALLLFKKLSDHFRHVMNLDSFQDLWQTVCAFTYGPCYIYI